VVEGSVPRISIVIAIVACAFALHAPAWALELQQSTGTVTGVVADETGAPMAQATVTLTTDGGEQLHGTTAANGRFSLAGVPTGSFQLSIAAHGFAEGTLRGSVAPGVATNLPEIRLRLTVNAVSVEVRPSIVEIADQQIKEQEQQRVFGFVPNFFISFVPDAAPLNPRQKFHLSWKARTDPVQFGFVGLVAGLQQWRNDYSGFGDGASGYAKRYAAAYATGWTRSMITQVVLPTVLRQDPRYFYKGTGSTGSRVLYAMSRSVIRKGDNGRWQPNYSGVLGSFASGSLSNLYYPEEDRRGLRLTLENTALGIAGGAIGHLAQEFLYARYTSRRESSK
jgi:hypothetical protein